MSTESELIIQLPNNGTNVKVRFPFKNPYQVQIDIITGTLRALLNGKNGLIESPTGTGKTQALLCAAGAFILHQRNLLRNSLGGASSNLQGKKIRVVYASRTHSQLAQVVREFKMCPYSKILQMAVLGSREHLCVHSSVNSLPTSTAQNAACNSLRSDRGCRYFHGVANFMADEQMTVQQHRQNQILLSGENDEEAQLMMNEKKKTNQNQNNNFDQEDDVGKQNNQQEQREQAHQVGLHDIEELGNLGRTIGFCPYFYEREIAETADIVFLPYSYIFDPQVVTQLPFSLDGCSLILDEAHNVPSYLAASKCLALTPRDTGSAVQDCNRAFNYVESQLRSAADGTNQQPIDSKAAIDMKKDMDDFAAVKIFLVTLEREIANYFASATRNNVNNNNSNTAPIPVIAGAAPAPAQNNNNNNNNNTNEDVKPGQYMLEFLLTRCCNMKSQTWDLMSDVINRAIGRLNESGAPVAGLTKVHDFFTNIFRTAPEDLTSKTSPYRFVVYPYQQQQDNNQNNQNNHNSNNTSRNCLGFWCLDSSIGMQEISDRVSSMVLASGTLSPMPHFAAELGVPFPITVQGGHVIQNNQLLSLVLRRGPSGVDLNSSYTNRNNVEYSQQLGMSLVSLAQAVPDGMIVFFPSYAAMNSALDAWKNRPVNVVVNNNQPQQNTNHHHHQTIWGMLSEIKPIHVEPRDTSESSTVVKEYRKSIDDQPRGQHKGAILLAVCRGKISEGLDFADRHGRAVVVTGLPFAHHGDLFVRLKKAHITAVAEFRPRVDGKLFTGDDWYKNEAMRAVNQALGRVIRHKDDFGAVILADDRFSSHVRALSGWVRRDNVICSEFRDAFTKVNTFFTNWKVTEQVKRDKELEERKKKRLEERQKLIALVGGEDGNNNNNNNEKNQNRGFVDAEAADEAEDRELQRLASLAAERAALALRQQQRQLQNSSGNNSNNNTVLNNLMGSSHSQYLMNSGSNNNNREEIPAPAALRSRSIFQKAAPKPASSSTTTTVDAAPKNTVVINNNTMMMMMPQQKQSAREVVNVDEDDGHHQSSNQKHGQQTPVPASSSSVTSQIVQGNAASEFTERLKSLITPTQYNDFKTKLRTLLQTQKDFIALTTNNNNNNVSQASKQQFLTTFTNQIHEIQQIFLTASDESARDQLSIDFGCFIPKNLRPFYSDVIRRRQRE